MTTHRFAESGIRTVALFEAAKGALVLAAGFGLLSLLHKDLQQAAESIVRHLHLNPARHLPRVFIEAATRMTDKKLWLFAAGAFASTFAGAAGAAEPAAFAIDGSSFETAKSNLDFCQTTNTQSAPGAHDEM
jgi:hypothetical protein